MGFLDTLGKAVSPAYLLSSFGKSSSNPYDKSASYLEQQPDVYKEHLSPYAETGQKAFGTSSDIYGKMAQDPAAYYHEIASSYNPQKGYNDYKNTQKWQALNATAAHGGYAGTSADQYAHEQLYNDLYDEDFQKYLKHVFGIGETGLTGLSHAGDTGYGADTNLAQLLGGNLASLGGNAYKQQKYENEEKEALKQFLLQLTGAGIGGAIGGPTGAIVGSNIGKGGSINSFAGPSADSGNWNTSTQQYGKGGF